ncbi:MAG TPA: DUF58 domain-containing protein [Acidimicrobiales bacterium]
MITPQGWLIAFLGASMIVAGRLFGLLEVLLVGVGLLAVVGAGAIVVARAQTRMQATRVLRPNRVHAGSPGRVELRLTNTGTVRTSVIELRDPVGEDRVATVLVGPLAAGATVEAQYAIDTSRRGIVPIGPLSAIAADPFGVARRTAELAAPSQLTVLPLVMAVVPLPHTSGDDPHGGTEHPTTVVARGDEFYALRPYAVGDDLRRVHWPTTARRDELVVRQDQPPWQARSTILLDTRGRAHSSASFEAAVSAAASVAVACIGAGQLVRLVTTGGLDSGSAAGRTHLDDILEQLAVVRTDVRSMADGLTVLHLAGIGGALAMLLGRSDESIHPTRAVHGFQRVVAVTFDATPGEAPFGNLDFPERWRRTLAAGRVGLSVR